MAGTPLSACFRCRQPYGQCTDQCRGYKGMPEPWIVRPSGKGYGVIHAATGTEAAWHADRGEAQKVANDFTANDLDLGDIHDHHDNIGADQ